MATTPEPVDKPEPWTSKGRATRARIIQTAAGLMHEHGVANTSTADILTAAGVSNAQLYHYFADKDDLTRAVITHQTDQVVGRHEALLSGLDSFTALDAWRDGLVEFVSERDGHGGCPIGSLASELADTDESAREALVAGFARWETAIRIGLAAMRDRGQLRADANPAQLALATLAALQGGLLLAQTQRDSTPLKAGLDAALGYIHTFAT